MSYPAAAAARLQGGYYNSSPFDPTTNPGGLSADGHTFNFPAALADLGAVAAYFQEGLALLQSNNAYLLDGQVATLPLLMEDPMLRNGDLGVWQRGITTFQTGAGWTYGPDGFAFQRVGGAAGGYMLRSPGEQSTFCARIGRTNGDASAAAITLIQSLEPAYAKQLRGQQLCFSVRVRCGSGLTANHLVQVGLVWSSDPAAIRNADGQYSASGGAAFAPVVNSTAYQDVAVTAQVPVDVEKIGIIVRLTPPVATAAPNEYMEVELGMLEAGFARSSFRRRNPSAEYQLARRFYRRVGGMVLGAAVNTIGFQMPVPTDQMYAQPSLSLLLTNPSIERVVSGAVVVGAGSSLSTLAQSADSALVAVSGFSGLTAGEAIYVVTNALIGVQAEID